MAYVVQTRGVVYNDNHEVIVIGAGTTDALFSLYYYNETKPSENGWYADSAQQIHQTNWYFDEFGIHILYVHGVRLSGGDEKMHVILKDTDLNIEIYNDKISFDAGNATLELHLLPGPGNA